MCNDPKKITVDLSKLIKTSSQTPVTKPTSNVNRCSLETMLTNCNESVDLIGHEIFTKSNN